MAYILPQTDTKKAVSKVENGRLMYENVTPGQVVTRELAGWKLSQIDMTRDPKNRFKFKFRKIFAPNIV